MWMPGGFPIGVGPVGRRVPASRRITVARAPETRGMGPRLPWRESETGFWVIIRSDSHWRSGGEPGARSRLVRSLAPLGLHPDLLEVLRVTDGLAVDRAL
jgi:hypothetical protein